VENELFRQDWRSREKSEILQYVAVKWAFVFLVGLLTALAALGINIAVENIAGLKFLFTVNFMQSDRQGFFLSLYLCFSNVVWKSGVWDSTW